MSTVNKTARVLDFNPTRGLTCNGSEDAQLRALQGPTRQGPRGRWKEFDKRGSRKQVKRKKVPTNTRKVENRETKGARTQGTATDAKRATNNMRGGVGAARQRKLFGDIIRPRPSRRVFDMIDRMALETGIGVYRQAIANMADCGDTTIKLSHFVDGACAAAKSAFPVFE